VSSSGLGHGEYNRVTCIGQGRISIQDFGVPW
jgi:hypothetical protein